MVIQVQDKILPVVVRNQRNQHLTVFLEDERFILPPYDVLLGLLRQGAIVRVGQGPMITSVYGQFTVTHSHNLRVTTSNSDRSSLLIF